MKEDEGRLSEVFRYIEDHVSDYVEMLVRICEVPAPTFQEEGRAQFLSALFQDLGYVPRMDAAGNVIVPVYSGGNPHVVLSAHLDTVFPFGTIQVERDHSMLRAPGISDDSAGLAALLLLGGAFRKASILKRGSLTFVATVGEEGLGNLRGARHFFENPPAPVDYFISLDGSDAERLVTVGLSSKRLRIFLRGPGGHSWGDAGTANPIHSSGELLSRIHRLILPHQPKTVINVGIIRGGTSINTIPTEVSLDVDLRSESTDSLRQLHQFLENVLSEMKQTDSAVSSEVRVVGERPSGCISPDHLLVRLAVEANQKFGLQSKFESGSTDSNIPFALGIPALTIGVGGRSGKIHTAEEWYDFTGVESGLKRIGLLIAELLNL